MRKLRNSRLNPNIKKTLSVDLIDIPDCPFCHCQMKIIKRGVYYRPVAVDSHRVECEFFITCTIHHTNAVLLKQAWESLSEHNWHNLKNVPPQPIYHGSKISQVCDVFSRQKGVTKNLYREKNQWINEAGTTCLPHSNFYRYSLKKREFA
jgi:hypothetical protein